MLNKSKTNSVRRGPYVFQPTKYDKQGNLYCKLSNRHEYFDGKKYINDRCKLTGLYHFDTGKFEIIWMSEDFLNHRHKKLLNYFLKEYDWL